MRWGGDGGVQAGMGANAGGGFPVPKKLLPWLSGLFPWAESFPYPFPLPQV